MIDTCRQIARVLGGSSRWSRARLFTLLILVLLQKRLLGRRPMLVHATFRGVARRIYVRDGADISVIREIFVDEEYALTQHASPSEIVDIGGHIGFASLYFSIMYPRATIRVYEPDPENFAVLQMNTRDVPVITAYRAAVSKESGSVRFFAGTSSISSSLLKRADSREISVEAVTLDEILSAQPADLIKFDVEGAEYDLFAASRLRTSCPHYIGEMHYDLIGHPRSEFLAFFPAYICDERSIGKLRSIVELRVMS